MSQANEKVKIHLHTLWPAGSDGWLGSRQGQGRRSRPGVATVWATCYPSPALTLCTCGHPSPRPRYCMDAAPAGLQLDTVRQHRGPHNAHSGTAQTQHQRHIFGSILGKGVKTPVWTEILLEERCFSRGRSHPAHEHALYQAAPGSRAKPLTAPSSGPLEDGTAQNAATTILVSLPKEPIRTRACADTEG